MWLPQPRLPPQDWQPWCPPLHRSCNVRGTLRTQQPQPAGALQPPSGSQDSALSRSELQQSPLSTSQIQGLGDVGFQRWCCRLTMSRRNQPHTSTSTCTTAVSRSVCQLYQWKKTVIVNMCLICSYRNINKTVHLMQCLHFHTAYESFTVTVGESRCLETPVTG
jgi:hypothetical protein